MDEHVQPYFPNVFGVDCVLHGVLEKKTPLQTKNLRQFVFRNYKKCVPLPTVTSVFIFSLGQPTPHLCEQYIFFKQPLFRKHAGLGMSAGTPHTLHKTSRLCKLLQS